MKKFAVSLLAILMFSADVFAITKGNIDNEGGIGMSDAILSLQICTNLSEVPNSPNKEADVNGDEKIGLEEVVFVLQCISGIRHCPCWEKYDNNPVFSAGDANEWADPLGGMTVLIDDDEPIYKFKMWFIGGQNPDGDGVGIGYAKSINGVDWIPYLNNPVITHGNTWDSSGFSSGINVIKDGTTYKLWYEGIDNNGNNHIGYATSSDGVSWIPYTNNPVFSPGITGSWDDDDVGDPCVIKDGASYLMWYWGDNDLTDINRIGLATSNDGINWQRSGLDGHVMSSDPNTWWENGEGVGSPEVIKTETGYKMVYHAADNMEIIRVGVAESSDGITWNKGNSPAVDVGMENAWESKGVVPGSIVKTSVGLMLWYLGLDADETMKFGLAVTCQ